LSYKTDNSDCKQKTDHALIGTARLLFGDDDLFLSGDDGAVAEGATHYATKFTVSVCFGIK